MLHKQALGYPGLFEKIGQVGLADHGIEIGPAGRVFGKKNAVMGAEAFDSLRCRYTESLDIAQRQDILLLKHGNHFQKDTRCALRVIDSAVVVFEGDAEVLCDRIQGILCVPWKQGTRHTQSIQGRKAAGQPQAPSICFHKAYIKSYVMSHQDTAAAK